MSNDHFRLADQIRHYRALAQIASDCAEKSPSHRLAYLDLAGQWTTLASRLEAGEQMERAAPSQARPRSSHSPQ
jgi:hypothetical protein